jgi:hypothetical protein
MFDFALTQPTIDFPITFHDVAGGKDSIKWCVKRLEDTERQGYLDKMKDLTDDDSYKELVQELTISFKDLKRYEGGKVKETIQDTAKWKGDLGDEEGETLTEVVFEKLWKFGSYKRQFIQSFLVLVTDNKDINDPSYIATLTALAKEADLKN